MKHALSIIIWLCYLLPFGRFGNLRRWANSLQQRLRGEHKAERRALPEFTTPEAAVEYINGEFDWRKDRGTLTPDWSSPPEVMQARLESGGAMDGDCDDYAAWVLEALRGMPEVFGLMRMSLWTRSSGHTVAIYRLPPVVAFGPSRYFVVDYAIIEVRGYRHALDVVSERHDYGELTGWVFETPELELVACYPHTP